MTTTIVMLVFLYFISSLIFNFFLNDTATPQIYTLSLHDALPIFHDFARGHATIEIRDAGRQPGQFRVVQTDRQDVLLPLTLHRSEEHTSELQSQSNLVCRLLLEKKKKKRNDTARHTCNRTWKHKK